MSLYVLVVSCLVPNVCLPHTCLHYLTPKSGSYSTDGEYRQVICLHDLSHTTMYLLLFILSLYMLVLYSVMCCFMYLSVVPRMTCQRPHYMVGSYSTDGEIVNECFLSAGRTRLYVELSSFPRYICLLYMLCFKVCTLL